MLEKSKIFPEIVNDHEWNIVFKPDFKSKLEVEHQALCNSRKLRISQLDDTYLSLS